MKKMTIFMLALLLAFISGVNARGGGQGGKPRVAYICKGYQDTYCYLVAGLAQKYYQEKYSDLFELDMFDGEVSIDKINSLIENCIAQKYAMIIYQLQDPDAHTPYVKAAMDAGITVLCGLGHINDNGASLYLEVNPEQQGTLPAQYLADQGILKRGTKVAILRGVDATFHAEGRLDGFTRVINKVGANLVASLSANYRTSEAQPIVENWLVSNPDLEVILCANDDMALGAISAIELAGKKGIVVTGIDANELGCIALKQDKMPATVAQPTLDLAYKAMDFAAQVVRGGKPQSLNLDSTLVLKKDADQILKDIHGYTQAKIGAIR